MVLPLVILQLEFHATEMSLINPRTSSDSCEKYHQHNLLSFKAWTEQTELGKKVKSENFDMPQIIMQVCCVPASDWIKRLEMSKTLVMIINNTQSKFLELTFFYSGFIMLHTHTQASTSTSTRCGSTASAICPFRPATEFANKNTINNLFHLLLIYQSSSSTERST